MFIKCIVNLVNKTKVSKNELKKKTKEFILVCSACVCVLWLCVGALRQRWRRSRRRYPPILAAVVVVVVVVVFVAAATELNALLLLLLQFSFTFASFSPRSCCCCCRCWQYLHFVPFTCCCCFFLTHVCIDFFPFWLDFHVVIIAPK